MLVIDASMTLAWYFADERTRVTDEVLDEVAENGAIVPGIWRLEVANALRSALRRQRIDLPFRNAALEDLIALPIAMDVETFARSWTETLVLSDRYQLTPYDAAYLELARRRGCPLATLDSSLGKAALAAGVRCLGAV